MMRPRRLAGDEVLWLSLSPEVHARDGGRKLRAAWYAPLGSSILAFSLTLLQLASRGLRLALRLH
jgi:hypothetical protein